MNRAQKAAVIEQIAADITASQAVFAIDYRGITVAQADALRARLRDCDASFRVVKNSLTERAADQAGTAELRSLLDGPTALTFVRGDAAGAAKAIADFARTTQLLAFKGGVMDGAALSSAEVTQISRLPSREVLYGQLVGLVANPIAGLARTLNALIGGLAVGLDALLTQRGGAPAQAASPASGEAEVASGGAEDASGEAEASGESEPSGEAERSDAGAAEPSGESEPSREAEAAGEGEATGAAEAAGEAEVAGEAEATGESEPSGEAEVAGGEAEVADEAEVAGEAEGSGEAERSDAGAAGELEDGGEPASESDQSKEN